MIAPKTVLATPIAAHLANRLLSFRRMKFDKASIFCPKQAGFIAKTTIANDKEQMAPIPTVSKMAYLLSIGTLLHDKITSSLQDTTLSLRSCVA